MSKRVRSFFAVLSLFVLCAALAIAASATGLSSHRNSCTSTRASAYIESKNCHPGYVVTTGRVEGRYMPITNPSASPGYVYQSGTGAATCSPGTPATGRVRIVMWVHIRTVPTIDASP